MTNSMLWRDVGVLHTCGRLSLSDPCFFLESSGVVVVDLLPGMLEVQLLTIVYGEAEFVATVRLALSDTRTQRGEYLGEVNIEFAELALCDRDEIEGCLRRTTPAETQRFFELEPREGLFWRSHFADGTTVLVVKPGFCDENCRVWALCNDAGQTVGVEVICIDEPPICDI